MDTPPTTVEMPVSTRRNGDLMNSLGNTLAATLQHYPDHLAYLNPD